MKIKVIRQNEAKYLDVYVAVRYDDEDMAYDDPLRHGESWNALINLDEGRMENWPLCKTVSFHDMKVGCPPFFGPVEMGVLRESLNSST
jgi:hypothetical protein